MYSSLASCIVLKRTYIFLLNIVRGALIADLAYSLVKEINPEDVHAHHTIY